MLAFCPVDTLSEVINKKRVALVQLGVIASLVGLVLWQDCIMAASYFTVIALMAWKNRGRE